MLLSGPEPLSADHDVSQFSCGKPTLDHWLKTRALSNQQKGFTAVLVVHEAGRVVGYYGLAPIAVVPSVLPRSIRTGQPPNPIPCMLLGQLATDIGSAVGHRDWPLKHALNAFRRIVIGGRALMVNAVAGEAAELWQRRGFEPTRDDELVLFRSISDIAASLREAGR